MFKSSKEYFAERYVSYSCLSCYDDCPRQFKLRYLDGIPCPSGPAAELGIAVHKIIAEYLESISNSDSTVNTDICDLLNRISSVCAEMREESELSACIDTRDVEILLQGYVKLMPTVDPHCLKGIEQVYKYEIDKYRFISILDLLLCDEHGKHTIVDFKTGNPKYVDDLQIQMYALPLLKDISSQPVDLVYAFLKNGTMKKSSITAAQAKKLSERLLQRIHSIEADEEFPARPSPLCGYCGVRDECDYRTYQ